MPPSHEKNSHCSYCGAPFAPGQPWPRTCAECGNTSYLNPLPVAVVLVPMDNGVVLIRRGIEPGRTKWALPGGFIGLGESWQEAGAREVREEAGIQVDPAGIRVFQARTPSDGTLLIFGLAQPLRAAELEEFQPSAEALERAVLTRPPADMAFRLHRETLEEYFASREAAEARLAARPRG